MKLYTLQLAVVVLNTIVSRRVSNSVAFVSLAWKLHLFQYLGHSYFYEPSVLIYRGSSSFVENVVLERERWWLRCLVVPPTL